MKRTPHYAGNNVQYMDLEVDMYMVHVKYMYMDFPGGSDSKESAYNAGNPGSIPGSERSPGEGHGNPIQYSCLENPMDRGAWQGAVHGVTESRTRLSN